jgi:hypothetical protein
MAEHENAEVIIERNGVLAVPAWIGPAKIFVLKRGRAYRFGLFVLTPDRVLYATDNFVLLDAVRADVATKTPRFLAKSGFWIKMPSASYWLAIHFRRPFSDATLSGSPVINAVGALDEVSNLNLQAALGLSREDLAEHLYRVALLMSEWKEARATTTRVEAALKG